jgi:hypothetical protein
LQSGAANRGGGEEKIDRSKGSVNELEEPVLLCGIEMMFLGQNFASGWPAKIEVFEASSAIVHNQKVRCFQN